MKRKHGRKEDACRFCGAPLSHTFVDLGMSPLCESYRNVDQLNQMEPFYPLHVYVCGNCFLVQLEEFVPPEEIFTEYAYFSSYADSWVEHMRRYADAITDRLGLGRDSLVVEVASNDGYLLQHFVNKGIPVLGIEPAANVAKVAIERGIPTLVKFFGRLFDGSAAGKLRLRENTISRATYTPTNIYYTSSSTNARATSAWRFRWRRAGYCKDRSKD